MKFSRFSEDVLRKFGLVLFLVIFTIQAQAQLDSASVLNLSQWREQQITEAENRIVRISNKITRAKGSDGKLNDIRRLEAERRVAAQSIDLVRELTIEDYFNIYLSQFSDSDAALVEAAKNMSKDEVACLLKLLLKSKSAAAVLTAPTSSIITGITSSSQVESKL